MRYYAYLREQSEMSKTQNVSDVIAGFPFYPGAYPSKIMNINKTISNEVLIALKIGSQEYSKKFNVSQDYAFDEILFPIAFIETGGTFNPLAGEHQKHKGLFQFAATGPNSIARALDPTQATMWFIERVEHNIKSLKTIIRSFKSAWSVDNTPNPSNSNSFLAKFIPQKEILDQVSDSEIDSLLKEPWALYMMHQQGATGFARSYVLGRFAPHVSLLDVYNSRLGSSFDASNNPLKNISGSQMNMFLGTRIEKVDVTYQMFISFWRWKMRCHSAKFYPEYSVDSEKLTSYEDSINQDTENSNSKKSYSELELESVDIHEQELQKRFKDFNLTIVKNGEFFTYQGPSDETKPYLRFKIDSRSKRILFYDKESNSMIADLPSEYYTIAVLSYAGYLIRQGVNINVPQIKSIVHTKYPKYKRRFNQIF